jgi:hypothetical protein
VKSAVYYSRKGQVFQDDFWAGKLHGSTQLTTGGFFKKMKKCVFRQNGRKPVFGAKNTLEICL